MKQILAGIFVLIVVVGIPELLVFLSWRRRRRIRLNKEGKGDVNTDKEAERIDPN